MARPSEYTPKRGDEICQQIAEGNSLRKVCLGDDMPHAGTVLRWVANNETFREQYARACAERREVRKEQLLDIPTDPDIDPQRGRLLSDNIKWVLAKEEPKKYGDRQQIEHSGEVKRSGLSDAEREAEIARLLQDPAIAARLREAKG